MTDKEINWDEVMAENERYALMCAELDKQIMEERKKPKDINDLIRASEIVNEYIKENNINSITIDFKDENRK